MYYLPSVLRVLYPQRISHPIEHYLNLVSFGHLSKYPLHLTRLMSKHLLIHYILIIYLNLSTFTNLEPNYKRLKLVWNNQYLIILSWYLSILWINQLSLPFINKNIIIPASFHHILIQGNQHSVTWSYHQDGISPSWWSFN